MVWVPSHCGVDSNEHVDELAKQALATPLLPSIVHLVSNRPFNRATFVTHKNTYAYVTPRALSRLMGSVISLGSQC